jgi:hypothetical protein
MALTVEPEDDEVIDSLTDGRPCESCAPTKSSGSRDTLPLRRHATGGRLRVGLPARILAGGTRIGAITAGESDDVDVGVVSRL